MRKYITWDLAIALFSTIFTLLSAAISHFVAKHYISDTIQIAAISAAFSLILGFSIRIWTKVSSLDSVLTHHAFDISNVVQSIDTISLLSTQMSHLRDSHPILQRLALQTLSSQMENMHPSSRGFRIVGRNWAMYANASFWKSLSEYLTRYKNSPAKGETRHEAFTYSQVIHSSGPSIWMGSAAMGSLKAQQMYIRAGGKIDRILVGPYRPDEIRAGLQQYLARRNAASVSSTAITEKGETEQYGQIIWLMRDHGIHVHYATRERDDLSHDFALTMTENGRYLIMTWNYQSGHSEIEECTFIETKVPEEFDHWNVVRANSVSFGNSNSDAESGIIYLPKRGA